MNSDDLFKNLFGGGVRQPRPEASTTRSKMALRQECAEKGHRYQVHGKTNSTKVACARCEVSWAIGPRTESSA